MVSNQDRPYQDEEWLRQRVDGDGASPEEVAEECGVTEATIERWLNRHGIRDNLSTTEIVCKTCGSTVRVRECDAGRGYCSPECRGEDSNRVEVECEWCGDMFSRKPSVQGQNDRDFCSTECVGKWQSEVYSGGGNPSYSGERDKYECVWCGEEVERFPSEVVDTGRVFCGMGCRSEWFSSNMSGENSPSWKGGSIGYYGPDWREQRRKALERDMHTCQGCGVHEDRLSGPLCVHHIRPFRTFNSPKEANRLQNLVSLCRPCHKRWEGVPIAPSTLRR